MSTLDVDIGDLLSSLGSGAPSYRALTVTDIVAPPTTTYTVPAYRRRRPRTYNTKRNLYLSVGGRGYADRIPSGTVVNIETGIYGGAWRITRSQTGEPTALLLSQHGAIPQGAERITEAHDLSLFQTPTSLLVASLYQHSKGRRSIALAMMNQAIVLKARHSQPDVVKEMERLYMRFRKTSSLALSPGTEGEGEAALIAAVKTGTLLIRGEKEKKE